MHVVVIKRGNDVDYLIFFFIELKQKENCNCQLFLVNGGKTLILQVLASPPPFPDVDLALLQKSQLYTHHSKLILAEAQQ